MTDVVASEAPAFSVVADVAIVKGKTPASDVTWLSFPDGTACREAVNVINDLPHLVVESVFGLGGGLWGTRAARRFQRLKLVTEAASEKSSPVAVQVQSPNVISPTALGSPGTRRGCCVVHAIQTLRGTRLRKSGASRS